MIGLAASEQGFDAITLTWQDTNSEENDYVLERSTDGVHWQEVGTVRAINSFSAETEVETNEGEKPISQIQIGDQVLAYNTVTGSNGYYTVDGLISHIDQTVIELILDDETLTTTLEHPFYTQEAGWQKVSQLEPGEHVRKADGSYGVVQSITVVDDPQRMYNLSVDQAHSFFVGDAGG